jgi:hypothetical protein
MVVSNCNILFWCLWRTRQRLLGDRDADELHLIEDGDRVETPRGAFNLTGRAIPVQQQVSTRMASWTISAEWEPATNLVQASSAVHDEWVLCQTRYNTLKHKTLSDAIHEDTLALNVLVKGGPPVGTLLPISPTGKKPSPEAFTPFMFVQVWNRGFKQQKIWMRFAHDLDPVVLWDDRAEAEVRKVRPILPAVKSA